MDKFERTRNLRWTMKCFLPLLVLIALAKAVFAGTWPRPLPPKPEDVPVTAYPAPQLAWSGWFPRVYGNLEAAKKKSESIRVIFDGDSITDGWQTGEGRQIWPEFQEKYGAFDFGISGDRTEHVLWRLAQGQVEGLKPRLILLMIGTNNLGSNTTEEIAEGIKTIVKEYREKCPEAVILLQGIFPRSPSADDPARAKIKSINELIASLHDDKNVVFIDFGQKFLESDGSLSPEIMPDYLHLSPQGYGIWAETIRPYLEQYAGQE